MTASAILNIQETPQNFLWCFFVLRIDFRQGVFFMCRKKHLHGCCMVFFGLGLILGHCLESWLLCCFGGLVLAGVGICVARQR